MEWICEEGVRRGRRGSDDRELLTISL